MITAASLLAVLHRVWLVTVRLAQDATRPQPDGNAGRFYSICAADQRPPEAKEQAIWRRAVA